MLYSRKRLYCMTFWACEMYMVWHERTGRLTAKKTEKETRTDDTKRATYKTER
jgi:hypothetical protein